MTHDTTTHVHDPDPPRNNSLAGSVWIPEVVSRFKKLFHSGKSHSLIAKAINEEFGISISRSASIGKSKRLGLSGKATTETLRLGPAPGTPVAPRVVIQPDPPLNVILADLGRFQCRWITNDDMSAPLYCGHPVSGDTSWCSGHRSICCVPARRRA